MGKIFKEELKNEISIVHIIGKELQSSLDIDKIVHVVLTGITAGYFLGFSRAFVMFYDENEDLLYGKRGIGPIDEQEANFIWSRIEKENLPIEKFFENGERESIKNSKFNLEIEKLKIKVNELPDTDYFKRTLKEKKLFVVYNAEKDENIPPNVKFLLHPCDAVISPIFTETRLIGIIFADNSFHRKEITEEIINLFSIICVHAALSLENAFKFIELKNLQRKLIEKERFATIGKIASYITHEVKNPLVTIGGFSKQILETDDINKIKRDAKIIYSEIIRLENIIDNIVNFSSLSEIIFEEVDISELIRETIEFFINEIDEKKINIEFDLSEIKLKCDSIQMKEVFLNIIKNAIENNREGGKIIINCEKFEEFYKIIIMDTGYGMDEETLRNVMTPFFTTKKKGIGLGLTISKEIIERHNGRIEIESKINEWTKVSIYLPKEVKNEKENIDN
ncbi:MAG: ATP-binding protein [Candidatus Ratteibacteria bacterium]